jgi:prepilin-type N-terminal cleavage/methylation domain-containing protein
MRKNQKGFTIIELLVVIVIIGILVALALPNLFSAQARGRDTDRKTELKNAQQKLETHFNDNGGYPADWTTVITAADERTGPRNDAYTYDPSPDGCTGNTCTSFTISANLENDNDPDATSGNYVVSSVNQ